MLEVLLLSKIKTFGVVFYFVFGFPKFNSLPSQYTKFFSHPLYRKHELYKNLVLGSLALSPGFFQEIPGLMVLSFYNWHRRDDYHNQTKLGHNIILC